MIKKYGDIISGSFVLLVSIVLYIISNNIKQFNIVKLGADFVPKITAISLMILAIILIFNGIKTLRKIRLKNDQKEAEEQELPHYKSVAKTLVLLFFYVFLLERIGFIIMTTIFLFIQIIILSHKSQRNYVQFLIISTITSVSAYYLFVNVFKVMIPAGILG